MVEGDTLETIALQLWGDASFWYMLADANGLTGSETLTAGVDLIVPNKVHNVHNSDDTFRVYDPNKAQGNTFPSAPKPGKPHNCGVFGQILVAIVAIAVTQLLGPIAGDIAKQLTSLATGDQTSFNWKEVGVTAATAILLGPPPGLSAGLPMAIAYAVESNALNQGLSMAVGIQKSFDWTSVAASAVTAGAMYEVGTNFRFGSAGQQTDGIVQLGDLGSGFLNARANGLLTGMAGAIAGAATRTLVKGTDFGDNIIAALPDVMSNTIGSAYEAAVGGGKPFSSEPIDTDVQPAAQLPGMPNVIQERLPDPTGRSSPR